MCIRVMIMLREAKFEVVKLNEICDYMLQTMSESEIIDYVKKYKTVKKVEKCDDYEDKITTFIKIEFVDESNITMHSDVKILYSVDDFDLDDDDSDVAVEEVRDVADVVFDDMRRYREYFNFTFDKFYNVLVVKSTDDIFDEYTKDSCDDSFISDNALDFATFAKDTVLRHDVRFFKSCLLKNAHVVDVFKTDSQDEFVRFYNENQFYKQKNILLIDLNDLDVLDSSLRSLNSKSYAEELKHFANRAKRLYYVSTEDAECSVSVDIERESIVYELFDFIKSHVNEFDAVDKARLVECFSLR